MDYYILPKDYSRIWKLKLLSNGIKEENQLYGMKEEIKGFPSGIQFVGTNPEWLGFSTEGYVFCAAIFWVFCYGMSRYSQQLEKKLDTGR